jgi:hypothetical protein
MNIDELIFKRTDKHWCFELWYENVIVPTQNKIQKPQFLLWVFLSVAKFFNELLRRVEIATFDFDPLKSYNSSRLTQKEIGCSISL